MCSATRVGPRSRLLSPLQASFLGLASLGWPRGDPEESPRRFGFITESASAAATLPNVEPSKPASMTPAAVGAAAYNTSEEGSRRVSITRAPFHLALLPRCLY